MKTTIKVKVLGKSYTACFYNEDFGQVKYMKANEAIDVEDYSEDGWWAIHFANKIDRTDFTLVVKFKVNEDGERTAEPIAAEVLNEYGIIMQELEVESVIVK